MLRWVLEARRRPSGRDDGPLLAVHRPTVAVRPTSAGHRFQKQAYCAACVKQRRHTARRGHREADGNCVCDDCLRRTTGPQVLWLARLERLPFCPTDHQAPWPAHWSPALDRPCQCEVYRLVERQATAFLPGAVEGSIISRRDTGRGYVPVIAGPFNLRSRRSDFRSRSLCGTPDAGGPQRVAQ